MASFPNQMMLVRERQQNKYETKLMLEEDIYSLKIQHVFNKQKVEEEQKKEYEKMQKIQLQLEKKSMQDFIDKYIINELNRNKGEFLDLTTLKEIATNMYYDRQLIEQQNEEYNLSVEMDLLKLSNK